jgi:hypothetical protein
MQTTPHRDPAHRIASPRQLLGNQARRLARPFQQAHRIACRSFLQNTAQLLPELRGHFLDALASAARLANPLRLDHQRALSRSQFRSTLVNRRSRHPRQLAQPTDSSPVQLERPGGDKQARLCFIEGAQHSQPPPFCIRCCRPRSHARIVSHGSRNIGNSSFCKYYYLADPNRLRPDDGSQRQLQKQRLRWHRAAEV